MAYNKVTFGGEVIIDLTSDTINASDLRSGVTAHDKSGEAITGTSTFDSDTSKDTVTAANVLSGITFHKAGKSTTGTMANNGAVAGTISTKAGSYTVPAGYHNGNGKVSISSTEQDKIIASNIRSGVSILGVTGILKEGSTTVGTDTSDATAVAGDILASKTAYAKGQKLTGTIPNKGAVSGSITTVDTPVTYPAGYYSSVSVGIDADEEAKIIASNIKSGVSILGVTGTLQAGSTTVGTDTSDATAVAGDILASKTAYAKGTKLTGTIPNKTSTTTVLSKTYGRDGIDKNYIKFEPGYYGINSNDKKNHYLYINDSDLKNLALMAAIPNKGAVSGSVGVGGSYRSTQNGYVTTIDITGPTLSGTATADHVLEDDTFYTTSGTVQTGTMANNGAVTASVGIGGSYTIPEGYHDGTGTVSCSVSNKGQQTVQSNFTGNQTKTINGYVTNIIVQPITLSGTATTSQVLSGATFYNTSGTIQTGTMTNNGAVSATVGIDDTYTIPAGYHNGNGTVTGPALTGNATASQVVSGATFYSASSTKQTGILVIQHYYTGSTAPSSSVGENGDIYLVS